MSGDTGECEIRKHIAIPESEYDALQARVKELEAVKYIQTSGMETEIERLRVELAKSLNENARLHRLVDTARQYKKATESRDMPEFKLERALFDAIDEIDEELKCPLHDKPGCACG